MKTKQIRETIDEYVSIDAQIKALEKRKDKLKETIVSLGEGAHTGTEGSVSVSMQSRRTLTADKVKKLLTPEQFDSCYSENKSIICRVTKFETETA